MVMISDETSLTEVLDSIFILLDCAATDRKSPMHTPVVASVNAHSNPNQRVMVLRDYDAANMTMRFHTDIRSPKVAEFKHNDAISILGYDPEKRIQLKIYGKAAIYGEGDKVTEAWIQTDTMGRRVYMCEPGSGSKSSKSTSGISDELQSRRPTMTESEEGRKNFAIMIVHIHQIDWMFLNSKGNRAASFSRKNGNWDGNWIIP